MILLNTTFACDPALEQEVISWIQTDYLPAAIKSGLFSRCTVSKIFPHPDADASSIAAQMLCSTTGDAEKWINEEGEQITAAFTQGRIDRIMAFSTLMEVIYECD